MTTVRNDLDSLASFRSHLLDFNRTLDEQFRSMFSHWQAMGEVWSDETYRQFGDALEEVASGVRRYLQMTEPHDAYLVGRIEALRQYFNH